MAKTIHHTIAMLRGFIKQSSDDSEYSDSYLYDILLSVRNDLLSKELGKDKPIGISLWKIICIEICPSDFIPCDCINTTQGYTVLKSKEKIPNYLVTRDYRYIQLRTIDNGLSIPYKTPMQGRASKYKKAKNKMWFTIIDGYLYVVNHPTNKLKLLMLNIILEDPRDGLYMSYCDNNGIATGGNCYNSTKDTFSIPPQLENPIMMTVLKQLGMTLQLPDDNSNNTQSSLNQY
jgi:hypothetical protein